MTGLEGPALAASGGRLLGSVASSAGRALARKLTFRWSVWNRARKRVTFKFSGWTYRRWLKSISAEELATPVEDIQSDLALRLDTALSSSAKWTSASDHLSRALRLTEATYPAIAAALGDADRTATTEAWAQSRSTKVRSLLLELAGPDAALSPSDLAAILLLRSDARRAVRLQAFDLAEAQLASYFQRIKAPSVHEDTVRVLVGDFGSGKSEVAETWHRVSIQLLTEEEQAPLPMWINAREVASVPLEEFIDRRLGSAWRQGRGASITIDGLDETEPPAAQRLFDSSRVLVRTHQRLRLLLTSRPGVLSPHDDEGIAVDLLTEDEGLELVAAVAGEPVHAWQWTPDMRTTVRRPFFALAAGIELSKDGVPHGEADLIRGLVEGALAKATERSAVTSQTTFGVLVKLAVSLTRSDRDGLSFSERQIARSSRLTVEQSNEMLVFSLPILQHWFAAQALLNNGVPVSEVVGDAASFGRWRWAAAVAALSAPDDDTIDILAGAWITGNAGAASWILQEAFRGHRSWRSAEDGDLDSGSAGPRLLRALRTWCDALGPMVRGLLPNAIVDGPFELGVAVIGHRISVAIARKRPEADTASVLPLDVHPLAADSGSYWQAWITGSPPPGLAWPWLFVQKQIAGRVLQKLNEVPTLGMRHEGIWAEERRYDISRRLLDKGSLADMPLAADDVYSRADQLFNAVEQDHDAVISLNGQITISGQELADLLEWLRTSGSPSVESNLPSRDVSNPTDGWVWNLYTPRRLMEFEVEVYGRACEAYDEAIEHSLSAIGWSLPSHGLAPFGIYMELRFDGPERMGNIPLVATWRVPVEILEQCIPPGTEPMWSKTRRAVVVRQADSTATEEEEEAITAKIRSWLDAHNRTSTFGWSSSGADDMSKARPASEIAAGWIFSDLKSLGLGDGTFPQLR